RPASEAALRRGRRSRPGLDAAARAPTRLPAHHRRPPGGTGAERSHRRALPRHRLARRERLRRRLTRATTHHREILVEGVVVAADGAKVLEIRVAGDLRTHDRLVDEADAVLA